MTIFAKNLILDVWQGSEYTSGYIKLLCQGSKRDTQKADICQTDYREVIHGSKTFKLTKD